MGLISPKFNFCNAISSGRVSVTVAQTYYGINLNEGIAAPAKKSGLVSKSKFQELEAEYESLRYNFERFSDALVVLGAVGNAYSFIPASYFEPNGIWLWVGAKRYNTLAQSIVSMETDFRTSISLLEQYARTCDINHNGVWVFRTNVSVEDSPQYVSEKEKYEQQLSDLRRQLINAMTGSQKEMVDASRNVTD